jgi:hypothetical protein
MVRSGFQSFDATAPFFGAARASHASGSPRAMLARLESLATLLDSAIVLPGGVRVGTDAVVGLFPGIGDVITTALAAYIVHEASKFDLPRHVLWRMIANVAIDGALGSLPVAGDVFDVFWRANIRNVRLLRAHLKATGQIA